MSDIDQVKLEDVSNSLIRELREVATHQGDEYMERLVRLSAQHIVQLEKQFDAACLASDSWRKEYKEKSDQSERLAEALQKLNNNLFERDVPECLFDYGDSAESVNALRDLMYDARAALKAYRGE